MPKFISRWIAKSNVISPRLEVIVLEWVFKTIPALFVYLPANAVVFTGGKTCHLMPVYSVSKVAEPSVTLIIEFLRECLTTRIEALIFMLMEEQSGAQAA